MNKKVLIFTNILTLSLLLITISANISYIDRYKLESEKRNSDKILIQQLTDELKESQEKLKETEELYNLCEDVLYKCHDGLKESKNLFLDLYNKTK